MLLNIAIGLAGLAAGALVYHNLLKHSPEKLEKLLAKARAAKSAFGE